MIRFGRDICGNLNIAEHREWLVTNGIGGFASGTVGGPLTRRYHGMLIAALQTTRWPDAAGHPRRRNRHLWRREACPLFANRWAGGVVEPDGYRYIEQFYLDGAIPVWHFAIGDALLEKRIWMHPDQNTTYVRYRLLRGSAPLSLNMTVQVNYRDFHSETRSDDVENGHHPGPPRAEDQRLSRRGLVLRAAATKRLSRRPTTGTALFPDPGSQSRSDGGRRQSARGTLAAEIGVGESLTVAFSTEPDRAAERRRQPGATAVPTRRPAGARS